MHYDLGLQGLGIVIGLSLAFGLIIQLLFWRSTPHWLWIVGALAYFAGGLFVSEVMFATATEADIQPIIDGLAFDETLLAGLMCGVAAVAATYLVRRVVGRPA